MQVATNYLPPKSTSFDYEKSPTTNYVAPSVGFKRPTTNYSNTVSAATNRFNDLNSWSSSLNQAKAKTQLSESSQKTTPTSQTASISQTLSGNGTRDTLVKNALSLVGTPYAWGGGGYGVRSSRGTGRGTQRVVGVDCSGLVAYAYGTIGIKLPHSSNTQLRTAGYKTNIRNLQPGDLVGWAAGGHVAVYVGNNQIVEAPAPGGFTRVRALSESDYARGVYGVHTNI
jgi:cell wall-associated NlpC family hydrolase